MTQRDTASKDSIRAWLAEHSNRFQYALTLTLRAPYATQAGAATVARRFHHKFNRAVWGGRRSHTHRIAWAAVVQGDDLERYHLHAAVGNIPRPLAHFQLENGVHFNMTVDLLERFKQTALHTEGVWNRLDFWPIESHPQAWTDYITRKLTDGNDCALLIDDMDLGSR